MRRLMFIALGVMLMAMPAKSAELYVMGGANFSEFSSMEFNSDNLGFAGEVGAVGDYFGGGLQISNLCIDDGCDMAAAGNARIFVGDWLIRPYVLGGIGASFNGDPLTQYGGGLMWVANDEGDAGSFSIYAGWTIRDTFVSFDDWEHVGNEEFAEAGLMLTF